MHTCAGHRALVGRCGECRSASTDEDGRAWFPAPHAAPLERQSFEIVSVMATGCTWDWSADRISRLAPTAESPAQLDLTVLSDRPPVTPGGAVGLRLAAYNAGPLQRRARVSVTAPSGRVAPEYRDIALGPGGRGEVQFTWWPEGRAPGTAEFRMPPRARSAATLQPQ